jgi:uncharacterized membrane protein YhdT
MKSATTSWRDALSTVLFALSLTAVLAAVLFILVALNPKEATYNNLPWYYAGGCLIAAPILYVLCRWAESIGAPNK